MLELPYCNADTFQVFLNEFSLQKTDEFKIMVLDNGAFHKAKTLNIPENIALLFLPPYSPELNPAEKIWALLKREFTNKIHNSLDEISEFLSSTTQRLTNQQVLNTCAYSYIFSDLIWTT